jgi:conjugative relaxase-like TrwC/TraI family protein
VRTIFASSAQAAAAYYTRYLTEAPGEVPGIWRGTQAGALGLTGVVSDDDLLALLEGRDPVSGSRLGRPLVDRYLTNGAVVRAVAGFDATFSAPKSLSVLWALTDDDRLLAAHDTAVTSALAHLERFGSTTRVRSTTGRLHPDSQGLTMAMFRQTTSRSDDPQIHTHVVISGKVRTEDGRWMALDARYLKKHQRMLGGLYQSVLRNELAHEFGVAWRPITAGQAEIEGMPDELLAVFSKRSEQVEHATTVKVDEFRLRQGRDPNEWELGAIKREAAVDTRRTKSGNGVPELLTRWHREASNTGWDPPSLLDAVSAAARVAGPEPDRIGVDEIVAALSTSGSTWNRAQIVSAVCDAARPQAAIDGERWAHVIERVTDSIIERCVELDPADAAAPRRRSDGRSLWLEPISTHLTIEPILREEEFVLTWAIDVHTEPGQPSRTVDRAGLDVLQAAAAAAVAGHDRLVLVVGPAGAGKTTMLRAAVDDLRERDREVFGVTPSAKAARVLERETGILCDTLAKLLYEWHRDDRPPEPRYQLAAGATVLVDEAGMVSTPALARLVALAAQCDWRLALIGDHYQLQAVGRGGLFHELCKSSDVYELSRIHRFREPWEAAASLKLRQGDPRALDAYIAHDRVHPGSFEEHLATITETWLTVTHADNTVAVVCSSNDHVDAVNSAVQHARVQRGELNPTRMAPIGGGEHAAVGDVVVTRRNDRTILTSENEPVRNRELWRIAATAADGSLTVSAISARGVAVLPATYVREHVRLGYAATEHGYQGETVTVALELASAATTRRGLYSGATRGTDDNHILVVTDSHNINEARDVLEHVLASDRADTPATTQRRQLAELDRTPLARTLEPRCQILDWLQDLRVEVSRDLDAAKRDVVRAASGRAELETQLQCARRQLELAQRDLDPYWHAVQAAHTDVEAARRRWWAANHDLDSSDGRRQRRAAERDSAAAKRELDTAIVDEDKARSDAAPAQALVDHAAAQIHQIKTAIRSSEILDRWTDPAERARELGELASALDDWQRWADGRHLAPARIAQLTVVLTSDTATAYRGCTTLAGPLARRAPQAGIAPPSRAVAPPAPMLEIEM